VIVNVCWITEESHFGTLRGAFYRRLPCQASHPVWFVVARAHVGARIRSLAFKLYIGSLAFKWPTWPLDRETKDSFAVYSEATIAAVTHIMDQVLDDPTTAAKFLSGAGIKYQSAFHRRLATTATSSSTSSFAGSTATSLNS
jgi:hypothetical protein